MTEEDRLSITLAEALVVLQVKVQMWLTCVAAVTAETEKLAGRNLISFADAGAALLQMREQGEFPVAEIEYHMIAGRVRWIHYTGWVIWQI
jgi:hypothetical protein